MFIKHAHGGYRGTSQYASGLFLMIFTSDKEPREIGDNRALRALVRKVALHQCGHFMMGHVTLLGRRWSLSGSYGHDGLPLDASEAHASLWPHLHPVPAELVAAFWKGGGHNSAGAEAPALRAWAEQHLDQLRHLKEKST